VPVGFRSSLRGINNSGKVEDTIPQDKVSLFDYDVHSGGLVLPDSDRDNQPSLQGKDRYFVQTLQGKDAAIVDHGRCGLEKMQFGLISAVLLDHLTYYSYCHLRRKTVMLAEIAIGKVMQFHLAGGVMRKGQLRDVVAGFIKSLHRLKERLVLLLGRSKLNHYRLLHILNTALYHLHCQEGGRASPPCGRDHRVSEAYTYEARKGGQREASIPAKLAVRGASLFCFCTY